MQSTTTRTGASTASRIAESVSSLPTPAAAEAPNGALAAAGGAGSVPLGIYTSIASPPPCATASQSPARDELTITQCRGAAIVRRFALQAAARELLPRERVSMCLRLPRPDLESVQVLYSPAKRAAHYGGLCVCGSVWSCAVCAAKITERRRVELAEAVRIWCEERGGSVVLVSFTLRHHSRDSLQALSEALREAYRSFKGGKGFKTLSARYEVAGSVTTLEVTHGVNGWHPHLHALFFVGPGFDLEGFTHQVKERWLQVVARAGRDASYQYGVDVRAARRDVADYVAKWGKEPTWTIAHEMTKAPAKRGRVGGFTPTELLAQYAFEGNQLAGELWRVYALTFHGRNQLTWSRGFRSQLGLAVEQSDTELAEEQSEVAVVLASLTHHQWRVVVGNDARGDLLNIAASGDAQVVYEFLHSLGVM